MHIILTVGILVLMLMLVYRRTPLIFFAFIGVFFLMIWRHVSTVYIDLSDVIFAEELFVNIGGGVSSLTLACFYAALVAGLLTAFSPARLEHLQALFRGGYARSMRYGQFDLAQIGIGLTAAMVFAMYVELVSIGNIPFFTGMERYIYRDEFAGPMLGLFYSYQSFIFIGLGFCFLTAYLSQNYRRMLIVVLICGALYVYLVLVGNKFSGLFFNTCFFIMPLSVMALNFRDRQHIDAGDRRVARLISITGIGALTGLIGMALYNTFINVRNYDALQLLEFLERRIFVRQGQIWWTTHERVFVDGEFDPMQALEYVYENPIRDGNTSLLYLMFKDLDASTFDAIYLGSQYSGGYPAILPEMTGPVLSFMIAFLAALFMGLLMYWLLRELLSGNFLSAFAISFLVQPLINFHLDGKLFFTWNPNYYIKIVMTLFIVYFERSRRVQPFNEAAEGKPNF